MYACVISPSYAVAFFDQSAVMAVAAWPVPSSGAENVTELMPVTFSSFSAPAAPQNHA